MNKIRVAVAGCGNVSNAYIPNLRRCEYADVVALCDQQGRAEEQGDRHGIGPRYTDLEQMLQDVPFDLFVNLTSMGSHGPLNRLALQAGKHVWSEKPLASDVESGRELIELARSNGVRIWGAPNTLTSPAFRFMRDLVASGAIGTVYAAHGIYGHTGPDWGSWVYGPEGGSLFDLGIYNLTTLTGLLGPAKAVTAEMGTATPIRKVEGAVVKVEADDNAVVILQHGDAVYSVIQTGFVYGAQNEDFTIQLIGTKGAIALGGYDWDPSNVQVYRSETQRWERHLERSGTRSEAGGATQPDALVTASRVDASGYAWQGGASYVVECLATGAEPVIQAEHALHVMDVIEQAKRSAESGRRRTVSSTFRWPIP